MDVDVVVVGGGVVGLAVADALHRRGAEVACLEAGIPGAGQSAGRTRIFRHSHEDPGLVREAIEARGLWGRWEERAGRRLLGDEGALLVRNDPGGDLERLKAAGVDARMVSGDEQRAALGPWAPPERPAILEPGGAIRARRTIATLAGWLGDRLVAGCAVLELRDGRDHVRVVATEGVWHAQAVVVCAGAQTSALAAAQGLDIPIGYAASTRATYVVRAGAHALACLRDKAPPDGRSYYAAAVGSTGRYAVGSPAYDLNDTDAGDELHRLRAYVEACLPGLDPEPEHVRTCISSHPAWGEEGHRTFERGRITFVAGGQLFKFAPLIAERQAAACSAQSRYRR
ncbi:MAG: NAD(P)/FAD-dependent oxidoreductase [Solirubrobacterales bacterium]